MDSNKQETHSRVASSRSGTLSRSSSLDSRDSDSMENVGLKTSLSSSSLSSLNAQDSYPKSASQYALQHLIAEGAHGKVYFATLKTTGQPVAFKIIDLDSLNDLALSSRPESGSHILSDIIREIAILKKCRHENVIELKTAFVHKSNICLIMEYFDGGTLLEILKHPLFHHGLQDEDLIACILKQILKGLKYCHDNDILHRDLKASNVLINKEGICKLADFAFSGELTEGGEKKRVRHTFVGSSHWMAPEVMAQAGVGYNQSADIWSFGITALELANGRTPTDNFSELKVYLQTIEGPSPSLNEDLFKNYSKSFKDLIAPCLEKDPKKRPTAAQLLKHPFFKRVRTKGKDYVKEKLMSCVPQKKGKPVSSDDPLRSTDDDQQNSLEWDFDRDKFLAEKNKDEKPVAQENPKTSVPTTTSHAQPGSISRTVSPKPGSVQDAASETASVKSQHSATASNADTSNLQNETASVLSMDHEDMLTFDEEQAEREKQAERLGISVPHSAPLEGRRTPDLIDEESKLQAERPRRNSVVAADTHTPPPVNTNISSAEQAVKSPTKGTPTTQQQTSPQNQDTIEQRNSRASSRASLPEKNKPERVEKHGRFEISTASIKKKKTKKNGKKIAGEKNAQASQPTGTQSTQPHGAQALGAEGDKKVKRPFEISDVTDMSEIPGHTGKKIKQKPSVETLERKVNMLMKKMDHHHKNLLDIREICKANHEMIQHFYSHTLSLSRGNDSSSRIGGSSFPINQASSEATSMQQVEQSNQYSFQRQRQLELENEQLRRELQEFRNLTGGKSSDPVPRTSSPNSETGASKATPNRASGNSASESLNQLVMEQLHRTPVTKSTLNEMRKSNSQVFGQQHQGQQQQVSPNSKSSGSEA